MTDSAKRKLFEHGREGRATILDAPGEHSVSEVSADNLGRFRARIELPEREPYEVGVTQTFAHSEWERMRPGALIGCRVDPDNPKRVLLLAPESDEQQVRVEDSASLLASGKRAVATVRESEDMEMTAPGTEDPFYLLVLELRAEAEPESWRARFGQRVPKGAEELVSVGSELQVAYSAVGDDDAVAVDWPATTDGRFT